VLAAAAAPAGQPAATGGPLAQVNKVIVTESPQRLYTWEDSGESQSCFDHVLSEKDDDFVDGVVTLFDDIHADVATGSSHACEPVGAHHFDIQRFVADCRVAMHYVDLHITDANGSQVKINSLLTLVRRYLS